MPNIPWAERQARAARLKEALAIVQENMPSTLAREQQFIELNLNLAISEWDGARRTCRACGAQFVVDLDHWQAKGLMTPRLCIECRRAKRAGQPPA
jgi:hypothetical protein